MPAKKNDALGKAYDVEFNGTTYQVPPADDWDIDVLEAIDAGRVTVALRTLLGDEQYERFKAENRKAKALGEFVQRAGEVVGAGN